MMPFVKTLKLTILFWLKGNNLIYVKSRRLTLMKQTFKIHKPNTTNLTNQALREEERLN